MSTQAAASTFREGDEVVLAKGSYQSTLGIFLRLKEDTNWADISERHGVTRSHPVIWLAHGAKARPATANGRPPCEI
jgi:hypothetical protein